MFNNKNVGNKNNKRLLIEKNKYDSLIRISGNPNKAGK